MSILLAFSVAIAGPSPGEPAPIDVVFRIPRAPAPVQAPSDSKGDKEKASPTTSDAPSSRELARRLADVGKGHLDRIAVCKELVPLADRLSPETRASLELTCPSWFPVPAPPTFCRIDPCVTDVPIVDGADRTAVAPN